MANAGRTKLEFLYELILLRDNIIRFQPFHAALNIPEIDALIALVCAE